ncbi:MAG: DEAD/DEAH box helicase [Ardenticatenaceae bacterium]|nr:DEAD/DEAH box helicase [Ardenticatenaceae bacterium]
MTALSVTVDHNNLTAILEFPYQNSPAFSALSVTLAANINNLEYTSTGFKMPWYEFRGAINSVARVLKRERVRLELDDFSSRLVDSFLDDKKKAYSEDDALEITTNEVDRILHAAGFHRTLTAIQKDNLYSLLELKHGANFSVPGAGKTTTLLALHTVLKALGLVSYLFVVSPINAFISWEDEVNEIFGHGRLNVIRLETDHIKYFSDVERSKPDLILVNYEKLRKNPDSLISFFTRKSVHLVLDEAHRVKAGFKNLSYHQIMKLGVLAMRRDIMTGTPMPQSYKDISSQFEYLWPVPVVPDSKSYQSDQDHLDQINRTISRFFVRTTKRQLKLPNPKIIYRPVTLGPVQSELYELFRSEMARVMSGMDKASKRYFRHMGRNTVKLMQAATNPMLLGTEDEYFDKTEAVPPDSTAWNLLSEFARYEQPAKIEYLRQRVASILEMNKSNKVVVWSYFVRNIKLLETLLIKHNPVSIYGGVPTGLDTDENSREGRIRKFHLDPECRVLIANPQACGEGISLHKVCHFAIYLDRTFNAAHYLQSVDRIHRLGLPSNVDTVIEILVAHGTIDDVIVDRLNLKTESMGKVLDDPYLMTLVYDPEDIPPEESLGLNQEDVTQVEQHILNPSS